MKLLHAADLHVGCCKRYPDSLDRARLVMEDLLRLVKRYHVDVLVVAGDWFDRPTPNHEERAIVADLFEKCPVPIASITGNHDKWGKGYDQTALNWLSGLAPKFGHRVWVEPTSEEFAGAWWVVIPYNGWNSADMHLIAQFLVDQKPEDWDGYTIGMAHEFFQGAVLDSGFTGNNSKYAALPALSQSIDYWALGDIHKMQKMASNAWYPGAPYQCNFGETLPKGVLLCDLEDKQPEFIELTRPKPLVELTKVPTEWPDAYVKLTVRPEEMPHPLPACVVQLGSTQLPQDSQEIKAVHEMVSSVFLLKGMNAYLKNRGFSEKMVKRGMSFARTLVKKVQPD